MPVLVLDRIRREYLQSSTKSKMDTRGVPRSPRRTSLPRGWSALHQACVENRVCSHEETIRVLVHYHQLNLFQVRKHRSLYV